MLVEYFLSRRFGREFDSPHLHQRIPGFGPGLISLGLANPIISTKINH